MKVAVLQLNATVGALEQNAERLMAAYGRALARGAALVVAPELFLSGYPPRDLLHYGDFLDRHDRVLERVAGTTGDVPLIVGVVHRRESKRGRPLRNTAVVLHKGAVVHRVHKQLLPTYDVFDEDRYFEPGKDAEVWHWKGLRVGITICEDIWNDPDYWPEQRYRHDPVRELGRKGIDLLVNVSASPWHMGKDRVRQEMMARAAAREKVPLVQANLVGGNDELVFDGHSVVLDGKGRLLARGRGFDEEVMVVDLEGDAVADEETAAEEDLFAALALGTRDYVRKCGFSRVVLGLSGGIDSALTAAVAVEALGPENVLGVLMPGPYSSEGSVKDALALAEVLEIAHQTIPIGGPYEAVIAQMAPAFEGMKPDLTEENLQARLRGVTLMAISNKTGRLVMTTGNKSELAVGYCTLYGDMCGGLSVINDVPKTWVYRLCRWLNRRTEIIPWNTIDKPPSAELRPDQTDQDSLPPYDVLDAILDAYIVEHLSVDGIAARGFERALVAETLRKVDGNEYKRRKAAPGLKVTSKAFGVGRRMPIAQRFDRSAG